MDTQFRPLRSDERRILRENAVRTKEDYVWGGMVLFVIFCAAFAVVFKLVEFVASKLTTSLAFVDGRYFKLIFIAVILITFTIWLRRKTWGSERSRHLRADFNAGIAAVYLVEAVEAILVDEHEDEGQTVIVKTADGKTLVFADQFLERHTKRGFPWKRFEIVEAPKSKLFLGFRRLDDKLLPKKFAGPLPYQEAKQYSIFKQRWGILEVPFEYILAKRNAEQAVSGNRR